MKFLALFAVAVQAGLLIRIAPNAIEALRLMPATPDALSIGAAIVALYVCSAYFGAAVLYAAWRR